MLMNEPVAWTSQDVLDADHIIKAVVRRERDEQHTIPLYTHPAKTLDEQFKKGFEAGKEEGWKAHKFHHPAKTLTDEDIAKVVHELNQKARTPERWVTAMEIGAETIIQLRDELRKAQEK